MTALNSVASVGGGQRPVYELSTALTTTVGDGAGRWLPLELDEGWLEGWLGWTGGGLGVVAGVGLPAGLASTGDGWSAATGWPASEVLGIAPGLVHPASTAAAAKTAT